jgi:4-hydroxybenzoate polyprenyltransferase
MFSVECSMFKFLQQWAEFVKFSHTVFALPFALAAMAVAARENRGWPGWDKFALIVAAIGLRTDLRYVVQPDC